jgi:hypothetical protein
LLLAICAQLACFVQMSSPVSLSSPPVEAVAATSPLPAPDSSLAPPHPTGQAAAASSFHEEGSPSVRREELERAEEGADNLTGVSKAGDCTRQRTENKAPRPRLQSFRRRFVGKQRKKPLRPDAPVRLPACSHQSSSVARDRLRRQVPRQSYEETPGSSFDSDSDSGAESVSSSSSVEETFPTDAIFDYRVNKGQDEFKVQWSNRRYRPGWIPVANLQGSATQLVKDFFSTVSSAGMGSRCAPDDPTYFKHLHLESAQVHTPIWPICFVFLAWPVINSFNCHDNLKH